MDGFTFEALTEIVTSSDVKDGRHIMVLVVPHRRAAQLANKAVGIALIILRPRRYANSVEHIGL
jgi:hypothetical protein